MNESIAIHMGFKDKSMNPLLYAWVLRKINESIAVRMGFKEKTMNLLLYAWVLSKSE